jgi:glucose/arabinose dehydrogenase
LAACSILLIPLNCAAADTSANRLTPAEQRSGWRLLFDGESADQWRNYRSETISDGWVIEDGILTRQDRGAGDIVTREQFGSFELQLEYRISPGGNSGIMFHVTEEEDSPAWTGPEVQLQDNIDGHDPEKSGWLYQLYKPVKPEWAIHFENQVGFSSPDVADATRPPGEWNHVYLRVDPRQSEVCMNGVSYYYFVQGSDDWNERVAHSKFADRPLFGKATRGYICLQDHGSVISFRNIKIREIAADGSVPEPIDGVLPLKTELAFRHVEWEGWEPLGEDGRLNPPLRPIQITHAGDGSNRVFVVDQSGMIHVLPNDATAAQARLFADLRARTHQFKIDDEEGLLGFAFHPDYAENGEFFIYYSPEGEPRGARLSRMRVSPDDPDRADPDSEEVLLTLQEPFANHNGGPMAFGPDGYLYLGLGDGGGRNDPTGTGQSLETWLACVLRIDVDHRDAGRAYAIPRDNPFVGRPDARPEIYAYGLRNPWRLSFDRETGRLWLADVGQDLWEEIDLIRSGGNYGWSIREGTYAFGNTPGAEDVETVDPIWEYDHRIGKSITGGYVYRGARFPELVGHYLYGDYVAGKLWALQYDQEAGKVVRNMSIPWNGQPVLAFGEDEQGELFVTTPSQTGTGIFRFVRE